MPCEVLELVEDPSDPVPHMNLILRKLPARKFAMHKVKKSLLTSQAVRTGIFEDLESYEKFRALWSKPGTKPVTFWD